MGKAPQAARQPGVPGGIGAPDRRETTLGDELVVPLAIAREHEAAQLQPAQGGQTAALVELGCGRGGAEAPIAEDGVGVAVAADLVAGAASSDRVHDVADVDVGLGLQAVAEDFEFG